MLRSGLLAPLAAAMALGLGLLALPASPSPVRGDDDFALIKVKPSPDAPGKYSLIGYTKGVAKVECRQVGDYGRVVFVNGVRVQRDVGSQEVSAEAPKTPPGPYLLCSDLEDVRFYGDAEFNEYFAWAAQWFPGSGEPDLPRPEEPKPKWVIDGKGGDDTVTVTRGAKTTVPSTLDLTFNGGDGNDRLRIGKNVAGEFIGMLDLVFRGGSGNDTLVITNAGANCVRVYGDAGDDTFKLNLREAKDVLVRGGSGYDTLVVEGTEVGTDAIRVHGVERQTGPQKPSKPTKPTKAPTKGPQKPSTTVPTEGPKKPTPTKPGTPLSYPSTVIPKDLCVLDSRIRTLGPYVHILCEGSDPMWFAWVLDRKYAADRGLVLKYACKQAKAQREFQPGIDYKVIASLRRMAEVWYLVDTVEPDPAYEATKLVPRATALLRVVERLAAPCP